MYKSFSAAHTATVVATVLGCVAIFFCCFSLVDIFNQVNNIWLELDTEMAEFRSQSNELWSEMMSMTSVGPVYRAERAAANRHVRQADYTGDATGAQGQGQTIDSFRFPTGAVPLGVEGLVGQGIQHGLPHSGVGIFRGAPAGAAGFPGVGVFPTGIQFGRASPLGGLSTDEARFVGPTGFGAGPPPWCNCDPVNTCPAGPPGPPGLPGHPGPDGIPGHNGRPGVDFIPLPRAIQEPTTQECFYCPPGPSGPPGPPGKIGNRGHRGPRGHTGTPGRNSRPGRPGRIGSQGLLGPVGNAGPQGPGGENGTKVVGKTGAQGEPGPIGPIGDPGIRGKDALNGIVGPLGPPGSRGKKGTPGAYGPAGPEGFPGRPGTGLDGRYCACPGRGTISYGVGPPSVEYGGTLPGSSAQYNNKRS